MVVLSDGAPTSPSEPTPKLAPEQPLKVIWELSAQYVGLWHEADVQPPLKLGPFTVALPTLGAECQLTAGNQT